VGQLIEREFERISALVTRDLEGYPALQRKLLEEITKVEEDYKKCGEVPPPPPSWTEAVTAIVRVKSEGNEMVQKILEEIKRSVQTIHDKAISEYRRAYESRHKILNGFMPVLALSRQDFRAGGQEADGTAGHFVEDRRPDGKIRADQQENRQKPSMRWLSPPTPSSPSRPWCS